jgi:hypothetical protein
MLSGGIESGRDEYLSDLFRGSVNGATLDKMGKSGLSGALIPFATAGLRANGYEVTAGAVDVGTDLWGKAALGVEVLGAFGIRILTAPMPFFVSPLQFQPSPRNLGA